ncbi:3-isopropylmalate dehydratase small subunit [Leptospira sp. GIMC2001]|uniref:3-isopropylmalate dehydratase small subunit n=1 Tax=Leptospira sp. GIMC2001 TaxID=1513297 RepID=UPI00234AA925|nr:3-isopropylmalate dehydratase small subunit [Leptospira sp. GIMC2001]WCL49619.1 3-isopropylmalate dehydratase small subunit [Leptospira sp. GIMC2001]
MKAWKTHTGNAVPLNRKDIDTDQILPKQFMKKIDKNNFGKLLFFNWRYLDEEGLIPNPDFILNDKNFSDASILLAGENFGCGSSREHAPWALADYGIRVILAPSFADIFYTNAAKNGIALIALPTNVIAELIQFSHDASKVEFKIDLENQIISVNQKNISFDMPDSIRERIINGWDDIGMTMKWEKLIDEYESQLSWVI